MKTKNQNYILLTLFLSLLGGCGSGGGGSSSSASVPAQQNAPAKNINPIKKVEEVKKVEDKNKVENIKNDRIPEKNDVIDGDFIEEAPKKPIKEIKKNNKKMVVGDKNALELYTFNGYIENEKNGEIEVRHPYIPAMGVYGEDGEAVNNGKIIGREKNKKPYEGSMVLMESINGGTLTNNASIEGYGSDIIAMKSESKGKKSISINNGNIILKGDKVKGLYYAHLIGMMGIKDIKENMEDKELKLVNNGNIKIDYIDFHKLNPDARSSETLAGMYIETNGSKGKNIMINGKSGIIEVNGNYATGMKAKGENIKIINEGTISTTGEYSYGMKVSGKNVIAINKGTINNNKENFEFESSGYGSGMEAENEALAINEGTINIGGFNARGMLASTGGQVVNTGTINLLGNVNTGMYAYGKGSTIVNQGEIQIESGVHSDVYTHDGGEILTKGKIVFNNDGSIKTDDTGKVILDKGAKIRARRSLSLEGNIQGSINLATSKNETVYKNIVEKENKDAEINLIEIKSQPISLFYKSNLEKNKDGNINLIISKDKENIEKVVENKEYIKLAESLIDNEKANKFIEEIVKSKDKTQFNRDIKDLSGQIYTNIPREIFATNARFVNEDIRSISNLDKLNYDFKFLNGNEKVKNNKNISGYKERYNGFLGSVKISDSIYGTLGYEDGSIKFNENSSGKNKSIHTGLYKKLVINKNILTLGINGEYSFHEVNRLIKKNNSVGKSKFNSRTLGLVGEVSRKFGDSLYFEPTLGLNTIYGSYDKITEKNIGDLGININKERYLSILPQAKLKLGKDFQYIKLYTNIEYSYELGNMNKEQNISLLEEKLKYSIKKDSLEKEHILVSSGVSTTINNFNMLFEIGKELGKRENEFIKVGLGYIF